MSVLSVRLVLAFMLTTGYSKGFPTGGALSFSLTGGVRCIGGLFMVVGSFLVLATRTNSFQQVDFGVPTSRVLKK
jgi:hypothetical protein